MDCILLEDEIDLFGVFLYFHSDPYLFSRNSILWTCLQRFEVFNCSYVRCRDHSRNKRNGSIASKSGHRMPPPSPSRPRPILARSGKTRTGPTPNRSRADRNAGTASSSSPVRRNICLSGIRTRDELPSLRSIAASISPSIRLILQRQTRCFERPAGRTHAAILYCSLISPHSRLQSNTKWSARDLQSHATYYALTWRWWCICEWLCEKNDRPLLGGN